MFTIKQARRKFGSFCGIEEGCKKANKPTVIKRMLAR